MDQKRELDEDEILNLDEDEEDSELILNEEQPPTDIITVSETGTVEESDPIGGKSEEIATNTLDENDLSVEDHLEEDSSDVYDGNEEGKFNFLDSSHHLVEDDILFISNESVMGIPRLNVKIDHEEMRKPFLGGFRDRRTSLEYHHASTQTPPPPRPADAPAKVFPVKFHRESQTVEVKTRSTQQNRDAFTQMEKIGGYYIEPKTEEKIIIPKKYFSADENHKMKVAQAIRIQTLVRSWLARKRAQKLKIAQDDKIMYLLEQVSA